MKEKLIVGEYSFAESALLLDKKRYICFFLFGLKDYYNHFFQGIVYIIIFVSETVKKMKTEDLVNEYKKLGIDKIFNYEEFNNILLTTHSTRIEGSTLSFEEACELIQKGNTPGGKNIDYSLQVIDHYNALKFVLSEAEKENNLSVKFIQEIASKVMARTGEVYENILGKVDASKGEFRNTSVRAGNKTFMNFQKVPSAVEALVKELKELYPKQKTVEEQLSLSFYAHYALVNIHPFLDGNGRTSRLLMNFIQRKYDLPLGIVFSEDKEQYYKALDSVQETECLDKYNDFMFSQYEKHLQKEIYKQKKVDEEKEISFKPKFKR